MKVDAKPTKEFFISMLTRDIPLDRAILDLVDNSIDAAHTSDKDLSGLEIKINLTEDEFNITDNCGGIDIETATKYAFRFGRDLNDKGNPNTPYSVGQFGVGMKRTLFKLGENFIVKSWNDDTAFSIEVDVTSWLATNQWEFDLKIIDTQETISTSIKVNNLYEQVSEQFTNNEFINSLINQISVAHFKTINEGINIFVNEQKIDPFSIEIKTSEDLGAIYIEKIYEDVTISIRAGIHEQDFNSGGWYIICNGRLVESAEQSKKTLWGKAPIPKYHDRFAFFRGVIEFTAEDSSLLPWTTTKTGIDVDNKVFRYSNKLMIEALKPIIDFLNKRERERKEENEQRIDNRVLNDAIKNAESINIFEIDKPQRDFIYPNKETPNPITMSNISYQVNINKLEKVKELLGANSNKQVGEETFNYYFSYECTDE